MKASFAAVAGGVTVPGAFVASGVRAGIKETGLDLALIVSERPAAVAGVLTTNKVQAAPVRLCRERLSGGQARAVVLNSGTANACTGPRGRQDAERTAAKVAEQLGIEESLVLVCSTGTIGVPLPMEKVESGIEEAARALSDTGGSDAAKAIMTTDTVPKESAVEISVEGVPVRIGGTAKGAGMIEPNMATMLAVLSTDATVEAGDLQTCLGTAVKQSFNRISVDGDQSTNDTVLFLANGAAGASPLAPGCAAWQAFCEGVDEVTKQLAVKMVEDGEGATRFVTVTVGGAASPQDARKAARGVANSLLVKTSWFGGDPNWGRVMAAVGHSGAEVKEERVDICFDGVCAVKGGLASAEPRHRLEQVLAQPRFTLDIDLHLGSGTDTVYTCDCSEEYVKINSEYTT